MKTRVVVGLALGIVMMNGASLIAACSSDDGGSSTSSSSGSTSSSGSSGTDGGTDTGSTGTDASDGGGGGGSKVNGADCTVDGDCASGHCNVQGAGAIDGGGRAGSFCTITCAVANENPAPECGGAIYTGKCSGKKLCQIK